MRSYMSCMGWAWIEGVKGWICVVCFWKRYVRLLNDMYVEKRRCVQFIGRFSIVRPS